MLSEETKWSVVFYEGKMHHRRVPVFDSSIMLIERMLPEEEFLLWSPHGKPRKPRATSKTGPRGRGGRGRLGGRAAGKGAVTDDDDDGGGAGAADDAGSAPSDDADAAMDDGDNADDAAHDEAGDEPDPMLMDEVKQIEDMVAAPLTPTSQVRPSLRPSE